MGNINRYKFNLGSKPLILTTEHDNLFMEEVERLVTEKYKAIQGKMPKADPETLAILLAINAISVQLTREQAYAQTEAELASMKEKVLKKNVTLIDLDEIEGGL